MSQHFKHHANMAAVHSTDFEIVQKHHGAFAQLVVAVRVTHALEQLNLVKCGLRVVGGTLHYLQRDKLLLRQVPAEPHG